MWAPSIDFRHYIGYFVGAFCVAVYAAIFLYIYKDGEFERKMRRRADEETMRAGGLGSVGQPTSKKDQ